MAPGCSAPADSYYADGRIQSVTEPSGRTRSLTWDPRGLLASDTYGGDAWSYGYDGGFLRTATHGTSTWSYDHGPRGELRSVVQPEGGTFSYGRDGLAQLSGITPPAGGMPGQTFGYDQLGRETSRTRGTAPAWTTSWSSGEGTTTLPNGDTVARLLDGRGRVARKTLTAGAGSVAGLTEVTYAYNGLDGLMKAVEAGSDGGWSAEYGHDARGLTTSVKRTDAPDVGYAYRDSGQVPNGV